MRRTIQWGGDKGGVEWMEIIVVCSGNGALARMFLVATPIYYIVDGNGRGIGDSSARS